MVQRKNHPRPRDLHAQGGTVPIPMLTNIPHCRVELMLSARKLKDKDLFSKSDPICIVYMAQKDTRQEPIFNEIGRTEVIYNNLNPNWETKIQLDYFFEIKQLLRFDIYDIDTANIKNLARQDFLGSCDCHLADIVTAPSGLLKLNLKGEPKQKGELLIRAEEINQGQKEIIYLYFRGQHVSSLGICSCCYIGVDPFLEFHRIYQDGSLQLVHRTEVQKNTINPEWKPFEISVRHLCEGIKDREFLVQCFNFKFTGKHAFLGSAKLTVNQLIDGGTRKFNLVIGKKAGGFIHILQAECKREYTWLDFVKAGMQLEFAVSIDFTASNGNVNDPNSRHFQNEFCLNQYELAISSILEICEHYNNSKIFEAFGFGAKIPPSQEACHFFPLNIDAWQSNATGVMGVMNSYRAALNRVELYGPTNFEPTIRHFLKKCKSFYRDGSRYQILLIITDGLITDMERTKLAIIEASDQPLSIIIIGVGDEDFTNMHELDSDDSMLSSGKKVAYRDIVQFVPFSNYYGAVHTPTNKLSHNQQSKIQVDLAKAVLEEIPYQVTSYCKMHKIQPMVNLSQQGISAPIR